jgi:hypothetical protein
MSKEDQEKAEHKYLVDMYAHIMAYSEEASLKDHCRRYEEIMAELQDAPLSAEEMRSVIDARLDADNF